MLTLLRSKEDEFLKIDREGIISNISGFFDEIPAVCFDPPLENGVSVVPITRETRGRTRVLLANGGIWKDGARVRVTLVRISPRTKMVLEMFPLQAAVPAQPADPP
jgi:hypothetical protein